MRICNVSNLEAGMKMGKSIYNNTGGMMLSKGTVLTGGLIDRLKANKNIFVYIEDDISKGIEPINAIDDELKAEVTLGFKNIVDKNISEGGMVRKEVYAEVSKITNKLIDALSRSDVKIFYTIELMGTDMQMYYHSINVTIMSILTAMNMGVNEKDIFKMATGSLLHDIGIIRVDDSELSKTKNTSPKSKLAWDEPDMGADELPKEHVEIGYNMVKSDNSLSPIAKHIIYSHHEYLDGSGFPRGIKQENIPIYTRIVTMANEFDTLMMERSFTGIQIHEILEVLMAKITSGKLCKDVYRPFTEAVSIYPAGTIVKLSDGAMCIVVKENVVNPTRPTVRNIETDEEIDLVTKLSYFIDKVN